jgi:hypothetical protein
MFPMAPEDKLREVLQYQEDQRRQAARERMARAAPAEPMSEPAGVPSTRSPRARNPWVVARQVLHSIIGTHGVAHRNAAR